MGNNKLIISLTTIPTRINKLEPVLDSLINQDLKADIIYINIPKRYKRFKERVKIPSFITNKFSEKVKIFYLDTDYGPATKFIGSLLNPDISKKDVLIITDDDLVKLPNWTTKLMICYQSNKICCFEERKLGKEILWGYLGYIFRKDIFNIKDLLNFYEKIKNNCYLVDDHWLTGYCHYKKIKIHNIKIKRANEINDKFIVGDDSLVRLKGEKKRSIISQKCRKDILDKFQTEFPFWCCLGCCKKGKRLKENFNMVSKNKTTFTKYILFFIIFQIIIYKLLPKNTFIKLSIILFLFALCANKLTSLYKNNNKVEKFTNTIPKVIIQTYHKKDKIPEKVYSNIKEYAPDYTHIIYDDKECITFIKKYFNYNVLHTFNSLKGAHKADLFRYCYLYKRGGIYLDIKTELIKPLNKIFTNNYTYSVLSIIKNTVYQGIIATPPNNPLFLKLIYFMVKIVEKKKKIPYIIFTIDFHQKTKLYCNEVPTVGLNTNKKNDFDFYFFRERCTKDEDDCKDGLDRYGLCCYVYDGDEKIFKNRYSDFPW